MWFLTDGDMLAKDTFDPSRTNIRSKTCDLKGWLKKDTLQSDRINLYDKYGNKKGWLEKDTLNPDACGGVGHVVHYIDELFPRRLPDCISLRLIPSFFEKGARVVYGGGYRLSHIHLAIF